MPRDMSKLISQSKECIGKFHISQIHGTYSLLYNTLIPSHAFLPPFFMGLIVVAKNEVRFKGVNLKFLKPTFMKVEMELTDRQSLICIHVIHLMLETYERYCMRGCW
jgi:hypothetical protein